MPASINLSVCIFYIIQRFLTKIRRNRARRERRLRGVAAVRLARRRQIHGQVTRYCVLNDQVPVLALYFDGQSDLRPDFRLSRPTVAQLIALLHFPCDHGRGPGLEVLVFMFWLASATSYRVVSQAFSIPRSTVHDIIHRVANKIISLKNRVIYFPPQEELERISTGFERLAGSAAFTRVVGSIDGGHIRIKPLSADVQCYFNRKLFQSIQMQAMCDHQCQFLDVFIGYRGSVHDARVLKNTPVYVRSLYPPEGYCILGDGGYPCMSQPIALITPYREPVRGAVAARFNRHHAKARSVIERAFGIMKTRW
ncbi:protein ALP1-like [Scophthalmus maximus]|uniref:protein ALP1-like n=1 Tax=Scophthalmus maximus TaxID=52904 RepID=UPI001FA88C6F|nr:protein ALP1-like [Scophthalmus maximus]